MNIRRVILLCFVVVVPYTITTQGQESLPAFQDTFPPQTGAPVLVAPAPAPMQIPPPEAMIPSQPAQGLSAILASNETAQPEIQQAPPMGNQPEIKQEEKENKDIYLNFDNTELGNFINYIAEIKKLNLIPDKGVEGNKISLTIREPLSIEGAWNVFLTVIEMAGFSIVQAGDVYKIITKDKKALQPLPAYINIPVENIPDNDSNIRYVMFLTNLQAPDIKDLIMSMLSGNGTVVDVKDVNGLIITDKCFNIKTAVRVLQELDQMGTAETVTVMRLKTANALDVKTLLDTMIKQPEISPLARLLGKTAEGGTQFFPPGTRIIAEERTNSLILLGNPKPIKTIEDFIINHLDTELQDAKSPLHIFELQYTDASQIADILNEVTQAGDSATGQAAAKYGAIRGGVKYFKKMNFKVDKDGNRLIVSSSDKVDWKLLKQTIKDLDKPQPQVAIETLMVTVIIDDTKQLGGNMRLKERMLGSNIGFQSASSAAGGPSLKRVGDSPTGDPISLLGNMMSQIPYAQGLTSLTFGKENDIWSVFSMLKAQTNTTILAQPFITATNKAKAVVSVGDTRRVMREDSGGDGLKGYADAATATKLEITPQINIDGIIRMHVLTDISQFEKDDGTQTSQRKIETDVTLADGQVLVLGGFVKTAVTENKQKTPLLGDLPLLGWFFKSQKRIVNKQYLFIFLCPTIVKPRQTPGMGLYTKMKLHAVTDSIEESIPTKKLPDPVHNWFFNAEKENYSHKVIDFANARYQPTTVDIKNDPYYRTQTYQQQIKEEQQETIVKKPEPNSTPPVLSEQPPQPLPPQIATNLQLDQKREGMKNLLSVQAPTQQEIPSYEPPAANQENRTEMKNLLTQIPELTPLPTTDQVLSNQVIAPENGITQRPETLSPNEETMAVDVNQRNRLKQFLSNNPAIANSTARLNRRAMA